MRQAFANVEGEDSKQSQGLPPFVTKVEAEVEPTSMMDTCSSSLGAATALLEGTLGMSSKQFQFGKFGRVFRERNLGASNAWVISGNHTTTGKPILCNDPHLTLMAPSIWLASHVRAIGNGTSDEPQMDAMGASFVGLPGIVLGRNRHISWGVTNTGADVQDLYAMQERPDPNGNGRQFFYQNQWANYTYRQEKIMIKGKKPKIFNVRETPYGPILTDAGEFKRYAPGKASMPLAIRWISTDKGLNDTTYDAFFRVQLARNHAEWTTALRAFVAPSQNMMYADADGNIGYRMTGKIPIRSSEYTGGWVVPGNGTDIYDWQGFIPFDEMPSALNPAEGFLTTANNQITPPKPFYKHDITYDWDAGSIGYRAKRITDLICQARKGGRKVSVDDMPTLQLDYRSYLVADIVKSAVRLGLTADSASEPPLKMSNRALQVVRRLASWNADMTVGSPEATVASMWRRDLLNRITSSTGNMLWHNNGWLINILQNGDAVTCPEGCGTLLAQSLAELERQHPGLMSAVAGGKSVAEAMQWGKGVHQAVFVHQILG